MGCKYCGQANVDGGRGRDGGFICMDCIALDPVANDDLVSMEPLNTGVWSDIQYPPECYDVSRFKRNGV